MKKITPLFLGFIVVFTTLISSCKKEDQIEKNLWSGKGEWTISSLTLSITSSNPLYNSTDIYPNYGTITFLKNGTGQISVPNGSGGVDTEPFTYSNTATTFTITIDGDTTIMIIESWKRNSLVLSMSDSFTDYGESFTIKQTMKLDKN